MANSLKGPATVHQLPFRAACSIALETLIMRAHVERTFKFPPTFEFLFFFVVGWCFGIAGLIRRDAPRSCGTKCVIDDVSGIRPWRIVAVWRATMVAKTPRHNPGVLDVGANAVVPQPLCNSGREACSPLSLVWELLISL